MRWVTSRIVWFARLKVLVLLTYCAACCEDGAVRIVEPPLMRVDGHVRESITLRDLAGVAIVRDSLYMGSTDSIGYYSVPLGHYPHDTTATWLMEFRKEGYETRRYLLPGDAERDTTDALLYHLDVIMNRALISRGCKTADQQRRFGAGARPARYSGRPTFCHAT
jgi:hypothetical protein